MSVQRGCQAPDFAGMSAAQILSFGGSVARGENRACALKVLAAAAFGGAAVSEDIDRLAPQPEDSMELVGMAVDADMALAFGVSRTVAAEFDRVGQMLNHQLPTLKTVALEGHVTYAKLRTVANALAEVSGAVVAQIEAAVADAALLKSPRTLANAVWALIAEACPEEAARLRERRQVYSAKSGSAVTPTVWRRFSRC